MLTSPLILLVDDEPQNLKLLSVILADQGFSLAVATSGERGLAQAERRVPDLILLDALMPGIDGFEVCRRLKASPVTKDVPVLFMTALNEVAERIRGLELGAVDFLTKPMNREELLARIKTQLALRGAMKSLAARNHELEQARVELAAAAEELRRGKDALDLEVARQTRELVAARRALEAELEERRRAETERLALEQQILAISTPIIPISDRILIMPLTGIINGERASYVLEAALQGTRERRAEVMILDVTGVPRMDERVAAALIGTGKALRLLGAKMVLTGLRPEMAATLVSLNIDLGKVITKCTLKEGVEYALRVVAEISRGTRLR